jgi:hypothetical protein
MIDPEITAVNTPTVTETDMPTDPETESLGLGTTLFVGVTAVGLALSLAYAGAYAAETPIRNQGSAAVSRLISADSFQLAGENPHLKSHIPYLHLDQYETTLELGTAPHTCLLDVTVKTVLDEDHRPIKIKSYTFKLGDKDRTVADHSGLSSPSELGEHPCWTLGDSGSITVRSESLNLFP